MKGSWTNEPNAALYCFTKFKMHFVTNLVPDHLWKSVMNDVGQANEVLAKVQKGWDILKNELRNNPGVMDGLLMMEQEVKLRSKMTQGWVS
jgi:hypothetical protein